MGDTSFEMIEPSALKAFYVDFELEEMISNCDSNTLAMISCLEKAYGEMFGSKYNTTVDRKINMSNTAINGKGSLADLTGCKEPCKTMKINLVEMAMLTLINAFTCVTLQFML